MFVSAANIANRRVNPRGMGIRDLRISDRQITDALAVRIREEMVAFVTDPGGYRRQRRVQAARAISDIGVKTTLVMRADGGLEHQHIYDFPSDDALLGLCIAYLCDPRLPPDELRQCQLDECGRLFFRTGKRRYCSDRCSELGDQVRAATIRMPRMRQHDAAARARKHK